MGKSLKRNEDGMAMVLVIMAMLVFSLLGMASLSMASSNVNNSLDEREFQSAFYVAEAGVNYHTEVIKKNIKAAYDSTNTADEFFHALENNLTNNKTYTTDLFHAQEGYIPEAKVELKRLDIDNPRTYAVVSHGITDNATRTVAREIVIKWSPGFDASNAHAIYSRETMEVSSTVEGTVGSSNVNHDDVPIKFDWGSKVGDYYIPGDPSDDTTPDVWYPHGYNPVSHTLYGERQQMTTIPEYNLPEFPQFPDLKDVEGLPVIESGSSTIHMNIKLTEPTTSYKSISLASSSILTIDLDGEDRILMVDDLNLAQGHIVLKNGGSLKIYVSGNMSSGGDAVVNHPDPPYNYENRMSEEQFNEEVKDAAKNASADKIKDAASKLSIFVKGEKTITFDNNITLYGSLYGEKATITMGNSAKVAGNIITGVGNVTINGKFDITNTMIYAPLAHVLIEGGAEVNGPVISNTTKLDGGATVSFDPATDELIEDDIFSKEAKIISEGSVLEQ